MPHLSEAHEHPNIAITGDCDRSESLTSSPS